MMSTSKKTNDWQYNRLADACAELREVVPEFVQGIDTVTMASDPEEVIHFAKLHIEELTSEGKPNIWLIEERLSFKEIDSTLDEYNEKYAGRLVILKKDGAYYRITHFSILSRNGKAEYAINYHPFNNETKHDYVKIRHTRPAIEFFDGRFIY